MTKTIAKKAARRGLPSPAVYGTKGAKTGADADTDQNQDQDQEQEQEDDAPGDEGGKSKDDGSKAKSKDKQPPKGKKAPESDEDHEGENELSAKEVNQMIGKQLAKTLREELPKHQKQFVTEADLEGIITKVVRKMEDDSKSVTKDSIADVVDQAAKAAIDEIGRKAKASIKDRKDAEGGGEDQDKHDIELPISWCKGNLPLHGKQLLNCILRGKAFINEGIDDSDVRKGIALGEKRIDQYRAMAKALEGQRGGKALTSTGVGTGDELVPTDLSSELQRRLYLSSDLAAMMAAREINMPTQPYTLPIRTTRMTMKLNTSEGTSTTATEPGTGLLTMTAVKIMGQTDFTYEIDEDSLLPMLPFIQQEIAEASADAWEDALINGDDSATHQDSDTHSTANHVAKGFKGFRKLALAVSGLKVSLATGDITTANMRSVRKLLKKYALDPRKLVWVAGPQTALELQALSEVATLEKYGPRATILTGELAALFGIPIIGTERMREDLNASGVYDATTTTKSAVLLIRLDRFMTGRRREFMVELFNDVKTQQTNVVASFRKAFLPIETPSATVRSVGIGYNYTTP